MAPPKTRLVFTKDNVTLEQIPREVHKETIIGKPGKKN